MKVYSYCQSFKLTNYLKTVERKGIVSMNDLGIILKRNVMKMYSYCLSFKLTNYLKAWEREGISIDEPRIPCVATPII